jgi:co-chaperonin GroES (HSP10)
MATKEQRLRIGAKLEEAKNWRQQRDKESAQQRANQRRQVYVSQYQIKPINENILIEPLLQTVKIANLWLPNTQWSESRNCTARVVAVGKYVDVCKPGDIVVLWHLSGWKYNDQRIVHQELVYAVSEGVEDVR